MACASTMPASRRRCCSVRRFTRRSRLSGVGGSAETCTFISAFACGSVAIMPRGSIPSAASKTRCSSQASNALPRSVISRDQPGLFERLVRRVAAGEIAGAISVLRQETGGVVGALPDAAVDPNLAVLRQLAVALAQLRQGEIDGGREVSGSKLVRLAHIEQQGPVVADRVPFPQRHVTVEDV